MLNSRNLVHLTPCLLALVVVAPASTALADVFNMGGVRDPLTGQWTGVASIEMVPVGNQGNAPDPATGNLYGQVNYNYNIDKYDVTIGQYTAFLNAVAATDPNNLWNVFMTPKELNNPTSGITRSGNSGSYTYTAINPNFPVTEISFWNACRFTNWLQNGQPTHVAEAIGTTETGTYDLTNTNAVNNNSVIRTPGATWAISSENEWYKAAYYDPSLSGGAGGYWLYPTRSNYAPDNTLYNAATDPNDANYYVYKYSNQYTDPTNNFTAVGTFAASTSAYGTFDQAGDAWQLNDTIILYSGSSFRGMRGGSYYYPGGEGATQDYFSNPTSPSSDLGFRVIQLPEPASLIFLGFGAITLVIRRRRRNDKAPVAQAWRLGTMRSPLPPSPSPRYQT